MCLNGIQNILENEFGVKCINFIFLFEVIIFFLRNEKKFFFDIVNLFILLNNF